MKNWKHNNYSEHRDSNIFNRTTEISGFDVEQSERRFINAINKNFDKFIMRWIKINAYNAELDGFRYLDNKQKSNAYIEFIVENRIQVERDDYIEYTYLKFIDNVDRFFNQECYLLTDNPHRFYKFKY